MSAHGYCLVTVQDGLEFVSTVAVSEEDAESLLSVDTLLHRAAGWRVVVGQRVPSSRDAAPSFVSSAHGRSLLTSGEQVKSAPSRETAVPQ